MAGERTYSDKEFALILKKAAKLSGTAAAAQSSPRELTLDEMKAIAAEAGLDPALIERAAHFLPRVETSLGGWGARKVSASFPLTLTREQTEQLLSMLNATLDHPGVGEATSSGLAWRGSGFGAPLVTMHREGEHTRVRVSTNPAQSLILSVPLGVMAAWILAIMLEPITAGTFSASVVAGLAIITGFWVSTRRKTTRALNSVVHAVDRALSHMRDTDEAP